MPLAPDIQYYIDCSCQGLDMAEDTAYYLRYIHPDANGLVDGYSRQKRTYRKRKHSDTLRDMGRYCEENYLAWRTRNREASIGATYFNYEVMGRQIETFVDEYSVQMVNRGHQRLTERAIVQSDNDYAFYNAVAVLKRAATRSYHDLHGYESSRLDQARAIANVQFDALRQTEHESMVEFRRQLGAVEPGTFIRNTKLAKRELARKLDAERRVVKRSVKLAEAFIGEKTTRMFIGGEEMRIEGEHCVYVLKRSGVRILQGHGQATLSLHTKDTDERLCNICIYTDGVPLLDHVISLLLHIKAGDEHEILTVGNLYNIQNLAHDQAWLVPYLPKRPRVVPGTEHQQRIRVPASMLFECYREPDRQDRIDAMRREISRFLFDALGEVCAPMPATRAMLLSGLDQRRFAITNLGQQVLGLDRLPTNVEMARLYQDFRAADLLATDIVEVDHPLYQNARSEIIVHRALDQTLADLAPAQPEQEGILLAVE